LSNSASLFAQDPMNDLEITIREEIELELRTELEQLKQVILGLTPLSDVTITAPASESSIQSDHNLLSNHQIANECLLQQIQMLSVFFFFVKLYYSITNHSMYIYIYIIYYIFIICMYIVSSFFSQKKQNAEQKRELEQCKSQLEEKTVQPKNTQAKLQQVHKHPKSPGSPLQNQVGKQ
ncbi:hypothetical protein RFI_17484, partial [Reticulomyxa filosa]